MFSDFTPIKYILKAIEIIILYLALLFSGTGNAHAQNESIVTQNRNTVEKIDRYLKTKKYISCIDEITLLFKNSQA